MTFGVLVAAVAIGMGVAVAVTWVVSARMQRQVEQAADRERDLARGGERTGAALARERALLASVLDTMHQGVVALDEERRITLINDAARVLLDLTYAPIGEPLLDHVRLPAILELLPPKPDAAPVELQTPKGIRIEARVDRLATGDGCILLLEDVTEIRKLETIRRDFVANVSHELRTPVAIIRANTETLLGGALDDPKMGPKLIDGLHRNSERLARILADLLDLSRLEAGHYRIELTKVPLAAAVSDAVQTINGAIADKKLAAQIEVADDLAVNADSAALEHVLVNLIDNAVKYTPSGGHVGIAARRNGTKIRVEVSDDGPGIAERNRERIFERFYRVDPGRSRAMGGTGLGLSIVKHLVESMGGQVGVDANEPQGSTFWVELHSA